MTWAGLGRGMGVEVRLCCLSDGRVRESAVEDLGNWGEFKRVWWKREGEGEEWRGGEEDGG